MWWILMALGCAGTASRETAVERSTLVEQGTAAGQAGDLDAAEAAFRKILAQNPNDGTAHFNLGSVYIDRAGPAYAAGGEAAATPLAELALVHFDQALAGDPPGPPMARLLSARLMVRLQRPQGAIERLDQFLATPGQDPAHLEEARMLHVEATNQIRYLEATSAIKTHLEGAKDESQRAEVRQAVAKLEAYIADQPDNWAVHWFLGKGRQLLDDQQGAFAAYEAAHQLDHGNPNVGRELGIAAMDLGRFDRAIEVTRLAMAQDATDPGLRANLALALLLDGNVSQSLAEIETAFAADPNDEITKRLRQAILDVAQGKQAPPTTVAELQQRLQP